MDQPLFHTWHDGLLAIMALGGVFVGVALGAQQLLILGGERFVHQGALALKACEAVLVPVAVLIGQVLFKITHTHTPGAQLGTGLTLHGLFTTVQDGEKM